MYVCMYIHINYVCVYIYIYIYVHTGHILFSISVIAVVASNTYHMLHDASRIRYVYTVNIYTSIDICKGNEKGGNGAIVYHTII